MNQALPWRTRDPILSINTGKRGFGARSRLSCFYVRACPRFNRAGCCWPEVRAGDADRPQSASLGNHYALRDRPNRGTHHSRRTFFFYSFPFLCIPRGAEGNKGRGSGRILIETASTNRRKPVHVPVRVDAEERLPSGRNPKAHFGCDHLLRPTVDEETFTIPKALLCPSQPPGVIAGNLQCVLLYPFNV